MEDLKSNFDLFTQLRSLGVNLSDFKSLLKVIVNKLNLNNLSETDKSVLSECLRKFCLSVSKRWRECSRINDKFLKKNESWLKRDFAWPCFLLICQPVKSASQIVKKRKEFVDLSLKQKKRRTESLRKESVEELSFAITSKMSNSGNQDVNTIFKFLTENPQHVEKVRYFCENIEKYHQHSYSKERALAIYVSLNLSKCDYLTLRKSAEQEGCFLYPSYYQIQQAKRECYPPQNSIMVTDTFAKITLQSLLDHTGRRILESLKCAVTGKLVLIGKCGFDGASGQSNYKQKFENSELDDSSIFMTAYVPLKLFFLNDESNVLWENPRTSSPFYCRPVNFQFVKESKEIINNAWESLKDEINILTETKLSETTSIKHTLLLTMIDGKICSTIAGSKSTMNCYICGAKPTEMNNLDLIACKIPTQEYYKFGMSSLHAWIRTFECLIHISYNIGFQKWSARTTEEKNMKKNKKMLIQEGFKKELGLNVDMVKQGFGTTNDGNTARRFFENATKSAEITGLDINLIKRFYVILQTIASGRNIDICAFQSYAKETAQLYIKLYSWYYMPATVHKILLHGAEIIKTALLPIGYLSEEAAEARNKDFRKYREVRSRKCNRKFTNEDILNNLLISSDPVISNLRPIKNKRNFTDFPLEVLSLLENT